MSCCASASHSHVRTDPATLPGPEDSSATYLDPRFAPTHSASAPNAPDGEGCLPVDSACRAVQAQVLAASQISDSSQGIEKLYRMTNGIPELIDC